MSRLIPSLLVIFMLHLFLTEVSSAGRTLGNIPSSNHNHGHQKITFLMRDVRQGSIRHYLEKPKSNNVSNQIPHSTSTITLYNAASQTLDQSAIGLSFPTKATLQELEYGSVTSIDAELVESDGNELQNVGKSKAVYVVSFEDASSHMVVITASFLRGGYEDGLRLFGVHKSDVFESHVAFSGGTGKYYDANGFVVVKVVHRV